MAVDKDPLTGNEPTFILVDTFFYIQCNMNTLGQNSIHNTKTHLIQLMFNIPKLTHPTHVQHSKAHLTQLMFNIPKLTHLTPPP